MPHTAGFIDDQFGSDTPFSGCSMDQFLRITIREINSVVRCSSCSTCSLDPLPTFLAKKCLPETISIITKINNSSMAEGIVPSTFKEALVTPLLKNHKLAHDDMCYYRLISQLQFLSKVLERVVANRIRSHLDENNLLDIHQSAYRSDHSTETALIRVEALDKGSRVTLMLLNLSATFDMVVHQILLKRLEHSYSFSKTVVNWFSSYPNGRSQRVQFGNKTSARLFVEHGVPQGSVLGPILYFLYFAPVGNICRKHQGQYHCYADDLQLYLSVARNDNIQRKIFDIEAYMDDLKAWMTFNKLKLNAEKTKLTVFQSTPSSPLARCLCAPSKR